LATNLVGFGDQLGKNKGRGMGKEKRGGRGHVDKNIFK